MPADNSNEHDVARWRTFAAGVRAAAEQISDPEARQSLLDVAEGYERLAKKGRGEDEARHRSG